MSHKMNEGTGCHQIDGSKSLNHIVKKKPRSSVLKIAGQCITVMILSSILIQDAQAKSLYETFKHDTTSLSKE